MKLDDMGFGGKVEDREADKSGKEIDTTPTDEKEADTQDKVKDAMENDKDISDDDIDADTSGADSEDDSEEESDEEDSEEEEEEEESAGADKTPAKDEPAKADEESGKESLFSNVKENAKIKQIEADEKISQGEKERLVMGEFLNVNKDVIPESARLNFQKFIASSNDAFLHIDDSLHKLITEVRKYRDDIPLSERLSSAFHVVFRDQIAKQEQRKGEVKAEVRTQKVNRAAATPLQSSTEKDSRIALTDEQRMVYKRMGVPIPKKYR